MGQNQHRATQVIADGSHPGIIAGMRRRHDIHDGKRRQDRRFGLDIGIIPFIAGVAPGIGNSGSAHRPPNLPY
jgi:hypothetical protein